MKLKEATQLAYAFLRSAGAASFHPVDFSGIKSFCLFAGYPRSGHSYVGSVLDAHPNIVLAHEMAVLKYVPYGFSRSQLFHLILENSRRESTLGRSSTGYDYTIKDAWQGRFKNLEVIGDKSGGKTTVQLHKHPELLDSLQNIVGLPIKWIHVTRNPFDNIAAIQRRSKIPLDEAIQSYFRKCETVSRIKDTTKAENFYEMRHEDLMLRFNEELKGLCTFLGQATSEDYLEACRKSIYESPHQTRRKIEWSADEIIKVNGMMAPYSFLQSYSFDS
jgi:hypothetical protein